MKTFEDLQEEVAELVSEALEGLSVVQADRLGLDRRAALRVWVGEDFIAVESSCRRAFDYYGGMEYVDPEDVQEFGGYVFYSLNSGRVEKCMEFLEDTN